MQEMCTPKLEIRENEVVKFTGSIRTPKPEIRENEVVKFYEFEKGKQRGENYELQQVIRN